MTHSKMAPSFVSRSRAGTLFMQFTILLLGATSILIMSSTAATAALPTLAATAPTNSGVGPNRDNQLTGMTLSEGLAEDTYRVSVSTNLGALTISQHAGLALATGFESWTGQSELAFTGSMADINSALATASLNPFDNAGSSATVSINVQRFVPGNVFSPSNGHYYEFISSPGITWTEARTAAASQTFAGSTGYLASIPTPEINALVANKIPGAENVWFGARSADAPDSESTPQRNWHWSDGPLTGSSILQCSNLQGACDQTGGPWPLADLWSENEPNNSSGTEDAAVTNWGGVSGRWNDLPSGNSGGIAGYIAEFGDLEIGNSAPFAGTASASTTIPVIAAPNPPGGLVATIAPNSGSATISWDAPVEGASGYTVTASPGAATCHAASTETNCSIDGLTWGTQYTFSVASEGEYETGPASEPTEPVTPYGPPSAPGNVEAAQDHGVVTVSWDTPDSDGGSDLVSYIASASPGGETCAATPPATSCEFEGLALGTQYTFTVVATNENAAPNDSISAASSASNAVTPITVPSTPQNFEIESATDPAPSADGATRMVSWTAPESDGGLPIQSYTVTADPGGASCTATAPDTTCEIAGLNYGDNYGFSVTASNEYGTGPAYETGDPYRQFALPGRPVEVAALTSDGEVALSWSEPELTGGRPVTGYAVTSSPAGASCTVDAPQTSCSPAPIVLGTEYTFSVAAVTDTGEGAPSDASNAVTPVTPPGAPTNVAVSTYHDTASLTWDAPDNDGGLAIESYSVVAAPGGNTCTAVAPQRTCTVSGLQYGTEYSFLVSASNELGPGEEASSQPVTPIVLVPGAPTGVTVSASGPSSATISWVAPSENGGAALGYVVTSQPGGMTCRTEATSCVINGLSPSVNYFFVVQAFNSAGGNAQSSVVSPSITLNMTLKAQVKLAKKRVRPSVRPDQKLLKRLKPKRLTARRHYVGGTRLVVRSNKPATLSVKILRASGRTWRQTKYRSPAVSVRDGVTRIKFTGRYRARTLTPGRYRIALVLTDRAGNTLTPRPIDFRMLDW